MYRSRVYLKKKGKARLKSHCRHATAFAGTHEHPAALRVPNYIAEACVTPWAAGVFPFETCPNSKIKLDAITGPVLAIVLRQSLQFRHVSHEAWFSRVTSDTKGVKRLYQRLCETGKSK